MVALYIFNKAGNSGYLQSTMVHQRTSSVNSICSVLTCRSADYEDWFENTDVSTDDLVADAQAIVAQHRGSLHDAEKNYYLDRLLSGMLEHAPDGLGKRYVAIALHIAKGKGEAGVIDVGKAWLEHLFLPSQSISNSFL